MGTEVSSSESEGLLMAASWEGRGRRRREENDLVRWLSGRVLFC